MEWGCMQALIDFDGWRKWKDFSQNNTENDSSKKAAASARMKAKKNRMSLGSVPSGTSVNKSIKEEAEEIKQ
jgi:osomolarity two-component system response regulator SSK1